MDVHELGSITVDPVLCKIPIFNLEKRIRTNDWFILVYVTQFSSINIKIFSNVERGFMPLKGGTTR